jgi:hypothetical protein
MYLVEKNKNIDSNNLFSQIKADILLSILYPYHKNTVSYDKAMKIYYFYGFSDFVRLLHNTDINFQ